MNEFCCNDLRISCCSGLRLHERMKPNNLMITFAAANISQHLSENCVATSSVQQAFIRSLRGNSRAPPRTPRMLSLSPSGSSPADPGPRSTFNAAMTLTPMRCEGSAREREAACAMRMRACFIRPVLLLRVLMPLHQVCKEQSGSPSRGSC